MAEISSSSVLDREQIRQLMLRYAAAVDRRDFAMVAACFVDDAVAAYDEGSQRGSSGPIEGVERIVEYISGISHTDPSMHFIGPISVELDEIRSLSDRILVMFDGHIVGEADPAVATEGELGLMMAGIEQKEALR